MPTSAADAGTSATTRRPAWAVLAAALVVFACAARVAQADASPTRPADRVDFNRDVRPILSGSCFKCHGVDDAARKAKLRLDVRESALKGGKSGESAITPGKP